jgi:hypothetical protein
VDVPVRALGAPATEWLGFMGSVVVRDEVDAGIVGDGSFDLVEEPPVRARHVQPHDVADLLDKQRLAREREGLTPARLQSEAG